MDSTKESLFERPFLTADLRGTGGEFKEKPSDFIVEEIPAYLPDGEGQHLYVWVEKRGVAAMELIDRLASRFDVPRRDIGMAGMKDKHAITRQWLSLPAHLLDVEDDHKIIGPLDDQIEILEAKRHRNKLKTGHSHGNRFELRIRQLDVPVDEAAVRARAIMEVLQTRGVPNYFGTQRFGRDRNTYHLGMEILRGERDVRSVKRRLRRLAVNAVQSAVFNRVLAIRVERDIPDRLLDGDCIEWFYNRKTLLVREDNRDQAVRELEEHDAHITGPMPGPKMVPPEAEALALEQSVYREFDVNDETFAPFGKIAEGTRRALTVRTGEFSVNPEVDEAGKPSLLLGFSLPSGSYATVVLREIMKA